MGLGDVSHARTPSTTDSRVRAAELLWPEAIARVSKGVVLAAGSGSRLGRYSSTPKMLQPLLGVPLVERAVRVLFAAGLEEVIVVYGAYPEVGEYCRRVFEEDLSTGRVEVVFAPRWNEGNGASLAAAEPYIQPGERFVSVSGDHLTPPRGISALMEAPAPAVLVDASVPEGIDPAEATKVLCDVEGRIVSVGKDLSGLQGFRICLDAGAHLLTSAIFPYLGPRSDGGEVTLSAALEELARSTELRVVTIPEGCRWQDIDTPTDLRWAKKKALQELRSSKDGIVARKLNRPVSLAITSVLARLRPRPNAISAFAFFLALVAAAATLAGRVPGIVAALLIQAVSIIDGVDGEIARATFTESRFGRLLDGVADRLGDAAILIGVASRAWVRGSGVMITLALLGAAVATSLLSMSSKDRLELLAPGNMRPKVDKVERFIGNLLAGRDGRLLLVAVAVAFDIPLVGLGAVVFVAGLGLVIRLGAAAGLLRPDGNLR